MKNVKVMSSQQDAVRMRQLDVSTAHFNYTNDKVYQSDSSTSGKKEQTYIIATPPGDIKKEVIINKQALKKNNLYMQKQ